MLTEYNLILLELAENVSIIIIFALFLASMTSIWIFHLDNFSFCCSIGQAKQSVFISFISLSFAGRCENEKAKLKADVHEENDRRATETSRRWVQ